MMAWLLHKRQFGENAPFIVIEGRHLAEQWGDALFGTEGGPGDFSAMRTFGLLELAEGGTLFIRDINLISPAIQLKLAAALEAGKVRCRLTGTMLAEDSQLSVRLLPQLKNHFTLEHKFTPLRERKKDIPVIATGILERLAKRHNRKTPVLDKEVTKLLLTHHYRQGNVTELIQIIERAFFLAEGDVIRFSVKNTLKKDREDIK